MFDLVDKQRRVVKYLRLSVTDRCNLRCTYCMPERIEFMRRRDLCTFEELEQLVRCFVSAGVTHLRLTGGEPLARRGIVDLVGRLAAIDGVKDLSMTTNAVLLGSMAAELKAAGLTRVNVSLDTIDPDKFAEVTRWGTLAPVLEGIEAARAVGLSPIKINAVLVRGVNDTEAGDLIRWAAAQKLLLRFIEYMPIGIDEHWRTTKFMGIDDMKAAVEAQGFSIAPLADEARPIGGGPARYWSVTPPGGGEPSTVGFIAALTHNFCAGCNRVRLTSDGRVRECLSAGGTLSLRDMLRSGKTPAEILAAIEAALYGKVDGHGFEAVTGTGGRHTLLPMSALGG